MTDENKTIGLEETRSLLASDEAVVVEVLPGKHFVDGHLPGAIHIASDELERAAREFLPDETRTVVTYCSGPSCFNSRKAAGQLRRLGYRDVRVFEGGKEAWIDAGLELEEGNDA